MIFSIVRIIEEVQSETKVFFFGRGVELPFAYAILFYKTPSLNSDNSVYNEEILRTTRRQKNVHVVTVSTLTMIHISEALKWLKGRVTETGRDRN